MHAGVGRHSTQMTIMHRAVCIVSLWIPLLPPIIAAASAVVVPLILAAAPALLQRPGRRFSSLAQDGPEGLLKSIEW